MKTNIFKKLFRLFLVVLLSLLVALFVYFVLVWTKLWDKFNSVEKLKQLILNMGLWGRSFYVFLQFTQVTFIPIPSPIIVIAGSLVYGPFQAGLLSLAGILLGSAVAFFIGRVFGRKIVNFIVGKEEKSKWERFLSKNKYSFVLMMLLPCFPDDILCLVAGLTDMTWTFFMITQLITRPIGIFCLSFVSSGEIIPYHGWGLVVWGIIIIFSILMIYFSSKYNEKIENFIKKIFKRKKN